MSDGPHRSLPMRPWWRGVAKRGDNCSYAPNEVRDAFGLALQRDCVEELSPAFLKRLRSLDMEPVLFNASQSPQIEILAGVAKSRFEHLVLDNVALLSKDDIAGTDFIQRAVADAAQHQAGRYALQIEEHCQRAASVGRALKIRARLGEAVERIDFNGIARRVLQHDQPRVSKRIPKKTGLDDGVSLR